MIGLFVGRFQPFHNGHLRVVKDILAECEKVVIVVGSAQAENTAENPIPIEERIEMVRRALYAEGIARYDIVPMPDFFDEERWAGEIRGMVGFDVVYSRNEWTVRGFRRIGVKVKEHELYDRGRYAGVSIRKLMADGDDWESLVPKPVAEYLKRNRVAERIRRISAGKDRL